MGAHILFYYIISLFLLTVKENTALFFIAKSVRMKQTG